MGPVMGWGFAVLGLEGWIEASTRGLRGTLDWPRVPLGLPNGRWIERPGWVCGKSAGGSLEEPDFARLQAHFNAGNVSVYLRHHTEHTLACFLTLPRFRPFLHTPPSLSPLSPPLTSPCVLAPH